MGADTDVATVEPTNVTIATTPDSSTPFYQEAAFIIGMVILAVCLLFIVCAVLLCWVRPRGDPGYHLSASMHLSETPSKYFQETPPNSKQRHRGDYGSQGTVVGSWSPGQPIQVGIIIISSAVREVYISISLPGG